MRTIPVDHRDLDSVEEARGEIRKQIESIIKKKPEEIESPVSVSIELQALRHSEKPEDRSLADLVSVVTALRSDMNGIQRFLSDPENLVSPDYLREVIDQQRDSELLQPRVHEARMILENLLDDKAGTQRMGAAIVHRVDSSCCLPSGQEVIRERPRLG